jgi:hypothetical protein
MAVDVGVGGGAVVRVDEPVREAFASNLGGAIEFSLAHVLYKIMAIMGTGLGNFVGGFLVRTLEILAPHTVDRVRPVIDELLALPNLPGNFVSFLNKIKGGTGEIDTVLMGAVGSAAVGSVTNSVFTTLLAPVTWGLERKIHSYRPGPEMLYGALWRKPELYNDIASYLDDIGLPDALKSGISELIRPRPGIIDEIAVAYRRNRSPEAARVELEHRGMNREDIDKLFEISHQMPGINDLLRMMVREAFRDDIASRWKYDEDYPAALDEWVEKQGLSATWARKYWRAHWELPSPSMGIEMVRRAGLSIADFKELLKIADYPAGWRDYIEKLVYEPYTRVDVRRMYQMGVLDRSQVKATYKQLGYDDDHAEHLTIWTEDAYSDADKEVTKADALGAYLDGIITKAVCSQFLGALGYPPNYVLLLLARADYQRTKELTDLKVSAVRSRYVTGTIDRGQAYIELGRLNLPAGQVDILLEKWDTERITKLKIPPEAKLSEMYQYDTLDIVGYRVAMRELGYREDAVNSFTALVQRKKYLAALAEAEAARKEAERLAEKAKAEADRARREQEAAQKALAREAKALAAEIERIKKAYVLFQREQKGAELRKQSAQLKLENMDIEMSATWTMPTEQLQALYEHIEANKREMIAIQVQLAALPLTYKYTPQTP